MVDVLTTIAADVGVNMLADLEVTVLATVVIALEFSVRLSYGADELADVWSGTSIGVGVLLNARVDFVVEMMTDALARVSAGSAVTDVDLRTDVSVKNMVSIVMTALEFTMSASLER